MERLIVGRATFWGARGCQRFSDLKAEEVGINRSTFIVL